MLPCSLRSLLNTPHLFYFIFVRLVIYTTAPGPDETFHRHRNPFPTLPPFPLPPLSSLPPSSAESTRSNEKRGPLALHHQDLKGHLGSIDFARVRNTSSRSSSSGGSGRRRWSVGGGWRGVARLLLQQRRRRLQIFSRSTLIGSGRQGAAETVSSERLMRTES